MMIKLFNAIDTYFFEDGSGEANEARPYFYAMLASSAVVVPLIISVVF